MAFIQIERKNQSEVMCVSDEADHVQFIEKSSIDNPEPFPAKCDQCEESHHWRKVWVSA